MALCLLLAKMHFIFLNPKVLLFLEALQTTRVSKIPPFPIKTMMVNELFLESEIFPTHRKPGAPGHMEYDRTVAWVNASHPPTNSRYKLYLTTTTLSQGVL